MSLRAKCVSFPWRIPDVVGATAFVVVRRTWPSVLRSELVSFPAPEHSEPVVSLAPVVALFPEMERRVLRGAIGQIVKSSLSKNVMIVKVEHTEALADSWTTATEPDGLPGRTCWLIASSDALISASWASIRSTWTANMINGSRRGLRSLSMS